MNWELEFRRCLEKRWLIEMPEARALVDKEIQAARDDLAEAKASYVRQGYKWSTIQAYYAMFHACRALLYHFGYREKSHYCLSVAMRHLLVSRGLLEEHMVMIWMMRAHCVRRRITTPHFPKAAPATICMQPKGWSSGPVCCWLPGKKVELTDGSVWLRRPTLIGVDFCASGQMAGDRSRA